MGSELVLIRPDGEPMNEHEKWVVTVANDILKRGFDRIALVGWDSTNADTIYTAHHNLDWSDIGMAAMHLTADANRIQVLSNLDYYKYMLEHPEENQYADAEDTYESFDMDDELSDDEKGE